MGWILYIAVSLALLGGAWAVWHGFQKAVGPLAIVSVIYAACAATLMWAFDPPDSPSSHHFCATCMGYREMGAPLAWRSRGGWSSSSAVPAVSTVSTDQGTVVEVHEKPGMGGHMNTGRWMGNIALWSLPLVLVWMAVLLVRKTDRSLHCPRCRYLLVGCSRPLCPECGQRIAAAQWRHVRAVGPRVG